MPCRVRINMLALKGHIQDNKKGGYGEPSPIALIKRFGYWTSPCHFHAQKAGAV